jgi:uncharacterized membrane protein/mono/diheme cytochrome c family protein
MLTAAAALFALAGLPQGSPAVEVADLFATRCASCHSAGSESPKALKKWADAKNLFATASNPKLVVPGNLDDSELFQSVDFDDMPPPESDVAALTDAEKALIASWISGGATVPDELREGAETASTGSGRTKSPVVWLARFHPLIVHFPVGLLTAAFLAELLRRVRPRWNTEGAATFCLALGALSSVPSAGLGWLLAANSAHTGDDLELHRWIGVATAVLALLVWWAAVRMPARRFWLLLVLAAIVGAAGHTGGVLSYGADWLALPF